MATSLESKLIDGGRKDNYASSSDSDGERAASEEVPSNVVRPRADGLPQVCIRGVSVLASWTSRSAGLLLVSLLSGRCTLIYCAADLCIVYVCVRLHVDGWKRMTGLK